MSDIYPEHRAGWQRTSLDDIVSVVRNRENPQNNPSMPFIGMEQVEPHTMRILGTVPSSEMRSSAVHFVSGDVLYGRLRPYLNKVVSPDFEGLCSAEFIPLTPQQGILPKFIQYRINAADFVAFASHLDEGDRPRIDFDQIKQFGIDLPPEDEQRRIVAAIEDHFSRLDEAVALLERVQRNLKRYRASVLKAAVEGRLVPTEAELARDEGRTYEPASVLLERILDERRRRWKSSGAKDPYKEPAATDTTNLPPLPEGWTYVGLHSLIPADRDGMKTGPFGTLLKKHEHRPTGVPVFGIENIEPMRFVAGSKIHISEQKAEQLAGYAVVAGDMLISRSGTVGEVCVVPPGHGKARFSTNVIRVRFLLKEPLPSFFSMLLNGSPVVRDQISAHCGGTTRDFLNQGILGALAFPLPPLVEQQRIVAAVEEALSLIDSSERCVVASLVRCASLRQAILKWAFEGRLVDQDSTDESASILLERIRSARLERKIAGGREARKVNQARRPTNVRE